MNFIQKVYFVSMGEAHLPIICYNLTAAPGALSTLATAASVAATSTALSMSHFIY